jgi:hypothetical protein
MKVVRHEKRAGVADRTIFECKPCGVTFTQALPATIVKPDPRYF